MTKFTQDWFSHNIPIWEKHLAEFKDKPVNALEIGCFEGRATLWLLENILTHELSKIIAVDNFKGSPDLLDAGVNFEYTFSLLCENLQPYIKENKAAIKIRTHNLTFLASGVCLRENLMDIIYIDGSHLAKDVLTDAIVCWEHLKVGGVLIFDDYKWQFERHDYERPEPAIDAFLTCFKPYIKVLHVGYQVIIKRIK